MKKLLLMLGIVSAGLSYAQTDPPKEEWREIIDPFTENVRMFSSLERERIPYGILKDYSLETVDLAMYDGKTIADSIVIDRDVLAEIYRNLQMGRIHDKSARYFISFEEYSKRWRNHRANSLTSPTDTVPTIYLSGIYYKYAQINKNAINQGKIRLVNNQLLDVYDKGVWQNPYEEKEVVAVAAPFNVFKSQSVYVALPANLFLTNHSTSEMQIDLNDGNGYQPYQPGQKLRADYAQNGNYTWKFRIKNPVGEWLTTHIPIKIDVPIRFPLLGTSKYSEQLVLNGNHSAILRIKHRPGQNTTITRPFIVAEGFDPATIFHPEYPQGDITYADFISSVDQSFNTNIRNLLTHPNNAEYDIIYIDWVNGVGDIRENAETLKAIINWVNTQKQQAGSTEENVLMGQSMGGLVSKYALVKMEQQNQQHQVGLFIAHDSPFRGANVPPSTQFMSRHLLSLYASNPLAVTFGEVLIPFIASFQDVDEDNTDLNDLESYISPLAALTIQDTPAALQMTNYYVTLLGTPTKSFHNQWQNEFDALGYPQQSRNIAISNGNMCAIEQGFTAGDYLLKIQHDDASVDYFKTILRDLLVGAWGASSGNIPLHFISTIPGPSKIRYNIEIKTTPEPNNSNRLAYKGIIKYDKKPFWIGTITYTITNLSRNISSSYLPLDVFAGGTYNINSIISSFEEYIPGNAIVNQYYAFIPVASALDIKRNNNNPALHDYRRAYSSPSIDDINLSTGFDNLITESSKFGNNNYRHISFSPKNGNWLAGELSALRNQNIAPPVSDCSFFCDSEELFGPDYMCGGNNNEYTYSIPQIANATISWSAPGLTIVSGQGTSSVTVKSNGTAGTKTIKVTINSTECGSKTIEKQVHVGVPTMFGEIEGNGTVFIYPSGGWQVSGLPANYTAPEAIGATYYEWELPGNYQEVSQLSHHSEYIFNWELLASTANSNQIKAKSDWHTDGQIKVRACNDCGCSDYITLDVEHIVQNYGGGIGLSPNPIGIENSGSIQIYFTDTVPPVFRNDITDGYIYDMQMVMRKSFQIGSKGTSVDVSDLQSGVYVVVIDMQDGTTRSANLQVNR